MTLNVLNSLKIALKAKPIHSKERLYFEHVLIPSFGIFNVNRALFGGVGPYTWHYDRLFRQAGVELHTIDRRKEASLWGAKGRHVTGDLLELESLFPTTNFDIIIMMGLIGYGLNDENQVRNVLTVATSKLAEHGHLLVACEDRFGIDPVAIGETCTPKLHPTKAYCYQQSVRLPDVDYGFHFLSTSEPVKPPSTN